MKFVTLVSMKKQKTAVIISGGGMLVSYNAGVISELRKILNPDIIIAGSGGSALAAFYTSGQLNDDLEKKVWKEYLADKKIINPWRLWKIFDTDLLISKIKNKAKLDVEKVKNSATILEITALSSETGKIHYFNKDVDIFDAIQASHAVPIMAKKIKINGEWFMDSFASSHVYNHIERAFEIHNADKVIVINCINFMEKPLKYEIEIYNYLHTTEFHNNLIFHMDELVENYHLFRNKKHREKDVLYLEPTEKTKATPVTVDGNTLWYSFLVGKVDTQKRLIEIKKFLKL